MKTVVILDDKICKIEQKQVVDNTTVLIETNNGIYRETRDGNILDGRIKNEMNLKGFIEYCENNFYKIVGSKDNDYVYLSKECKYEEDFVLRKKMFSDFLEKKEYNCKLVIGVSGMFNLNRLHTEFTVKPKKDETYYDLLHSKEFKNLLKKIQDEKFGYQKIFFSFSGIFDLILNHNITTDKINADKIIKEFKDENGVYFDDLKEEFYDDFRITLSSDDNKYKNEEVLRYYKSGKRIEGVL